jgi:hypothetical protein
VCVAMDVLVYSIAEAARAFVGVGLMMRWIASDAAIARQRRRASLNKLFPYGFLNRLLRLRSIYLACVFWGEASHRTLFFAS